MGALAQITNQPKPYVLYDASGTITTGGTPQLILPVALSRSSLILQNPSDTNMFVELGAARASATLTNGAVTSITASNTGFNYSYAPRITLLGGGNTGNNRSNPLYLSPGFPNEIAPSNQAKAHCVMTGSAGNLSISSVVIDNGGSGYANPPYVWIHNDPLDPYGSATPSATSGVLLLANGGSMVFNGSVCPTDQVSVFCATTGKAFVAKFTT